MPYLFTIQLHFFTPVSPISANYITRV